MERKPTSHVLRVPPKLLETECAVVTHEDIDTMVADRTVERCDDSGSHGNSAKTSNVRREPRAPLLRASVSTALLGGKA
jgi:hypothetical protein